MGLRQLPCDRCSRRTAGELPTRRTGQILGAGRRIACFLAAGLTAVVVTTAIGGEREKGGPSSLHSRDAIDFLIRETLGHGEAPTEGQLAEAADALSEAEQRLLTVLANLPDGEALKTDLALPLFPSHPNAAAPAQTRST